MTRQTLSGTATLPLDRTAVWPAGGLVHFTCHGFGDSALAPVSYLRLADDVLLAHDVAYRRPPLADGSLVILNGCQTSVPDWRAVDDGMGLATAFLAHGAGVVLATSWSVADGCAAKMALTFVGELLDRGANPTDALREAQRHVRELSAEQILAWCDEVKLEFPESDCPAEAMKIHAQAAFVSKRSGLDSAARHHGAHAARLLRQLNCAAAAERILALTRADAPTHWLVNQRGFDDPTFWAAFQLIGRVT